MGNGKLKNWKYWSASIITTEKLEWAHRLFDARGFQLGGMTSMEGKGILVSFTVISF